MRYRNLKTGAIFDSPCVVSGDDWVAEETTIAIEVAKAVVEIEEANKEGFDGTTIKQIKQELEAFGIEYNPRAKKQELYDLMTKGR